MAIEKVPQSYSAATYEKIVNSLLRRIESLEAAQTVKKIASTTSDAHPLLKIGELGFVRNDSQNLDLVLRADDGRNYRIGALVATSTSTVGSGSTNDHGALSGLSDDDHTQYVLRSVLTTKGDLFSYSTVITRLAVGSDSQILVPDVPSTAGLRWSNLVFNNDEIVSSDDEIVTV